MRRSIADLQIKRRLVLIGLIFFFSLLVLSRRAGAESNMAEMVIDFEKLCLETQGSICAIDNILYGSCRDGSEYIRVEKTDGRYGLAIPMLSEEIIPITEHYLSKSVTGWKFSSWNNGFYWLLASAEGRCELKASDVDSLAVGSALEAVLPDIKNIKKFRSDDYWSDYYYLKRADQEFIVFTSLYPPAAGQDHASLSVLPLKHALEIGLISETDMQ